MLLTFGSGTNGCLGHGGYTDVTKPKIVEALLGFTVVQLSCGAAHVMIIASKNGQHYDSDSLDRYEKMGIKL